MRKSKKKRSFFRRFIVFLFLCVLIIGGGCGYYFLNLRSVGNGKTKVSLSIKEGESFDQVVDNLKSKDLIHSTLVSKLYARLNHSDTYYAGTFALNDGMSTPEIFSYLSDPANTHKDEISITIPEGTWAKEIAEEIHAKFPDYSVESIEATWNDINYIEELSKDYSFLKVDDLNQDAYKIKLEGYLFPDTYTFGKDATIDQITRTFLDRFAQIEKKYADKINQSDYSLQQILSLASVVQFESSSPKDMKKIAGVFYNRLEQGMNLGSSVTVCYALYDDFNDPSDCEVQTDIDSPYNTYLYSGLPIGPILNPGEDAIKAVLDPTKSDDLYFLADIHGDGTVYYSKTLEEHEQKMKELGLVIDGE